jgi:hypothetical protein
MTWRTLGEAMMSAVAKGIVDTGDAGIAVPTVSRKNAQSAKLRASATEPRQAGGENLNGASKTHMRPALRLVSSRCKPTRDPKRAPPRCVGFHLRLVVDNAHHATPF